MDEYKQDIEFIPGEPPHVAIFKNGLSMSDDEIEEEFHAFQNRIKELEGALRKIQQKTGAITIHTDGVDIEEIWTIATKSLGGK